MGSLNGIVGRIIKHSPTPLSLRIQSSVNGTPIPIVIGQNRVAWCPIWTDGYTKIGSSSGKGGSLGKGGQAKYSINILGALAEGPIEDCFIAWENQTAKRPSKLNLTIFNGTQGQTPWGFLSSNYPAAALNYSLLAYAGADPYSLGTSATMPNLTMELRGAIANDVFETYTIGSPYTFTPTYFNLSAATSESATIPPLSPYTYQAANYKAQSAIPVVLGDISSSGIIGSPSQGVIDTDGNVYTKVGSSPGNHQYSVSNSGLYTFSSLNANTAVTVIDLAVVPGCRYAYQKTSTLSTSSDVVTVSDNTNLAEGQRCTGTGIPAGTFVISVSGTNVTLSGTPTVSGSQTLTFWGSALKQVIGTPSAGEFRVSVQPSTYGQYQFASSDNGKTVVVVDVMDANAADAVSEILTNEQFGCDFPSVNLGSLTALRNYSGASGMFVSPVLTSQQAANTFLGDFASALNGEFVWSGSLLDFVPYGDAVLSGYGYSYTPDLSPQYDLTDDDFLSTGGSAIVGSGSFGSLDPIVMAAKGISKAPNDLKVEFLDRGNAYNPDVAGAMDDASINFSGRRAGDKKSYHFFCFSEAAGASVHLLLGRSQSRRHFGFTLPWYYSLLDPMDILSINEAETGLSSLSVRIKEITENQGDCSLSFDVEELLPGSGTPSVFGKQSNAGYVPNQNVAPPATNAPIIFTAPYQLAQSLKLGIIASGPSGWGGCEVYISSDDSTYAHIGTITAPGVQGTTTASFASGTDPDTTDTLSVDLTESTGSLISGSSTDADLGHTLCIVDDEIVAFSAVTPTSSYNYDLDTYIRRGMYGTAIAAHSSGAAFGRINSDVFYYQYDKSQVGSVVYIKLCAFNIYGEATEDLSAVSPITYTIGGLPTPGTGLFTVTPTIRGNQISWTPPENSGIEYTEIWRSSSSSFSGASKIDQMTAPGTFYIDNVVTAGTEYWYWLRQVDFSGNASDFYPLSSVSGISAIASYAETADIGLNAATITDSWSADYVTSLPRYIYGTVAAVALDSNKNVGQPIQLDYSGYFELSFSSDTYLIARIIRITDPSLLSSILDIAAFTYGLDNGSSYIGSFGGSADSWSAINSTVVTTNAEYLQLSKDYGAGGTGLTTVGITRTAIGGGLSFTKCFIRLKWTQSASLGSYSFNVRITFHITGGASSVVYQGNLATLATGTLDFTSFELSLTNVLSGAGTWTVEFSDDPTFSNPGGNGGVNTIQIDELVLGVADPNVSWIADKFVGKISAGTTLNQPFAITHLDPTPPTTGTNAYVAYGILILGLSVVTDIHSQSSWMDSVTGDGYSLSLVMNHVKR